MELSNFTEPKLSAEDFQLTLPRSSFVLNQDTASQLAATDNLLSGVPDVESYRSTRDSLTTQGGRSRFLQKQNERRNDIVNQYPRDLAELLSTTSLRLEDQQALTIGVAQAPKTVISDNLDILAEETLISDSRPGETLVEEASRMSILDSVTEVNQRKREISNLINGVRAERNPSTLEKAQDFVEYVLPFAEWIAVDRIYQEATGDSGIITDENLLGNQKEALFDAMRTMSDSDRGIFVGKMLDYVNENDSLIIGSSNDLFALDILENMLLSNDYSDVEKFLDNATSILDVVGAGALVRAPRAVRAAERAARASQQATEVPTPLRRAIAADTTSTTSPTSPSQIVKDTNPQKARDMLRVIDEDTTGEAAQGLSGTNRTDAIAKELLPEPDLFGETPNKVRQTNPIYQEPEYIRKLRQRDGKTYISRAEEAGAVRNKLNSIDNIVGFRPVKEQSTIKTLDTGAFKISTVYRMVDSGFGTAEDALANVEFALRKQGVTRDNLTLITRRGEKWVEMSQKTAEARKLLRDKLSEAGETIPAKLRDDEFAIKLDFEYSVRPEDISEFELLSTGRLLGLRSLPLNVLDRLPSSMASVGRGSISQHLFDANSLLHPRIVEPASVAVDKAVALKKAYVQEFKGFTDSYKKFSKEARNRVTSYINEANFEGLRLSTTDLYSRGFNAAEVAALKVWRRANDIMYYAVNDDLVKQLNQKGFQKFIHKDSDTSLVVKPVTRKEVNADTLYFNPATGVVESIGDTKMLDDLYESGGTYARLAEPVEYKGKTIDFIKSVDNSQGGYLRKLADGERVLAYREGYYPLMYDANFFITKTLTGADGKTYTKTIATSGTEGDARKLVESQQRLDPDGVYEYRPDRNAGEAGGLADSGWSTAVTSGMTTQRVRGERLLDAASELHKADKANILDPLESVARVISSLSERISVSDYLETTKARWINNYAEKLGLEKSWPKTIKDIVPKGGSNKQLAADARSNYNYIYSLENGYINSIDEGFKAVFNFGADLMDSAGWGKGEKALRDWGKGTGVTSEAKGAVFKMYLASNPLRQAIVQGHQTIQLNAINPAYVSGGGLATDLFRLGKVMRGYEGDPNMTKVLEDIVSSGTLDAVDANNLTRVDTLKLANVSNVQKTKAVLGSPIKAAQIAGFDMGERLVLVTSWLTHRDMALKAGKKLDARTIDEITGKSRAFTYNMNRAGDMPYNTNELNLIAQFLQVPHKAMLQPLTNRSLTPRQRAQLLTFNTIMYGVPVGAVSMGLLSLFPEGDVRDSFESGLEGLILNKGFSALTGEEQQIDWSDLTPTDVQGMGEFVAALWTGEFGKMLVESPSGSLFFGQNPRLTNLFRTTARWVNIQDDYDDPELNTNFVDVSLAFANLFSGASNAFKARYAFQTGTKISSLGNLTDADVTKFEATMALFGFRTKTETGTQAVREAIYGDATFNAGPGGDVDLWYGELKRQLARRGMTVQERDLAQRILTEGMRVFEDEPEKFQERLYNLIKRDYEKDEYNIFEQVMRQQGMRTTEDLVKMLDALPESEMREQVRESITRLGE